MTLATAKASCSRIHARIFHLREDQPDQSKTQNLFEDEKIGYVLNEMMSTSRVISIKRRGEKIFDDG
jgi:hypothetical protein